MASAAVLAQRGLWGVAHTRSESSARIKGATDTRRAEEKLFLLYPQAPLQAAKLVSLKRTGNLQVYSAATSGGGTGTTIANGPLLGGGRWTRSTDHAC